MARGGARIGAGRPKKAEKTKPIRIPERMVKSVLSFVASSGYQCPLYSSSVAAGSPSAADDHIQAQLDLNAFLVKRPTSTFFVKVTGESMLNAGINQGDILVVDRSIEPANGKIVIAAVDGLLTVKRLCKNNNENVFQLMPENDNYKPIDVTPESHVHIWGVVTSVIHLV